MTEPLYSSRQISQRTGQALRTIQILAHKHRLGRRIGASLVFDNNDLAALKALRRKDAQVEAPTTKAALASARSSRNPTTRTPL